MTSSLLGLLVHRAEPDPDERQIAEQRHLVDAAPHAVLNQPADRERLAGLQHHRGANRLLVEAGADRAADCDA